MMMYRSSSSPFFVLKLSLLLLFCTFDVDAQLATDKCKFLGNVVDNSASSSFKTYWNQVTPENSGKWGSVEATRDVMNWSALDNAYNYAKSNGFPFKHHTFVWGQQQPAWVAALMTDTSIPETERYAEVRGEVEEWIRLYSERYPDTDFIDVVNEPFHATPSYDLALGAGWNWVIWTFQKARLYCPNAKLILNDYNIINNDGATDSYLALIDLLNAENLIDGIGIQCHRFEVESAPVSQLKSNLDKLAATGLPIYISEFDLGNINNTSSGNATTDDNEQLETYKRVFPVLWDHPAVHGITIWGYVQGQVWQSTAYLLRSDGTERPALTWLKQYITSHNGGSFCRPVHVAENLPEDAVTIWPNPSADGNFTIESNGEKFEASIVDLHGRVLRKFSMNGEPVQVKLDQPGLYILKLTGREHTTMMKVVVK